MEAEIVGLIPAAGEAKRVSPLPASKELFPVGFREIRVDGHTQLRPKVISQYLIDSMFLAGAAKIWVVLGRQKADIMHYYGDGMSFGGPMAYLMMDHLRGMPCTLDQAYHWIGKNSTVLFGMPDTIFAPSDAFSRLLEDHRSTGSAVTLGIFPTNRPEKLCPVELDPTGRVIGMTDKPRRPQFQNTWGCATWSECFTDFMHRHLCGQTVSNGEIVLADIFRAAIAEGLSVRGLFFESGEYVDIGTPDDLALAVRRFSRR